MTDKLWEIVGGIGLQRFMETALVLLKDTDFEKSIPLRSRTLTPDFKA